MQTKRIGFGILRAASLVFGLVFPFVAVGWKVILLCASFMSRMMDSDNEHRWLGAASLFFIGMLLSYIFKLVF